MSTKAFQAVVVFLLLAIAAGVGYLVFKPPCDETPSAAPAPVVPPPSPISDGIRRSLGRANVKRAETQMANFEMAIHLYYMANRKLPASLETLAEADTRTREVYIDGIPNDPWGNPYDYRILSRKEFQILSYGEDAQEGTEDDVRWPSEE